MMRLLFAALSGSVFGLGLLISGMTDTTKIQGWLDIFGDWDPTLAFVLGGGVIPMMFAWRIAQRQKTSFLGSPIPIPTDPVIDQRLIIGSALFGIGWALSGLCPGPAMASISFGGTMGILFMVAMAAGMVLQGIMARRTSSGVFST